MADVRCPMCGKLNPAEAEVCQFCQARLKPLGMNSATPPAAPPSGADDADWLSSLRDKNLDDQPSEPDSESETPEEQGGEEGTDWLARIRERSQVEPDARTPLADWPGSDFKPEPPPSEEEPDWLKSIREKSEVEGAISPFAQTPESEGEGAQEEPEWLKRLREQRPPEEQGEGAVSGGESLSAEDIPGWLKGDSASDAGAAEGEPAAGGAGAVPDWLQEFSVPASPAPEESAPAAPEEGLPDWMKDYATPSPAETPAPPAAEDLPDWLTGLSEQTAATGPSAEAAEETPESAGSGETGEVAETPAEGPVEAGETPDWLKELGAASAGLPSEAETPAAEAGSTPSLLSRLGAAPQVEQPPSAAIELGGPAAQELDDQSLGEGLPPDWLANLQRPIPAEESQSSELASSSSLPDAGLPAGDESEAGDFFATGELPDWLAQLNPSEAAPAAPSSAEEAAEEALAPAELPTWVQAMRPVEAATPQPTAIKGENDQRVELSGPLAGLQGVLPSEPSITEYSKPPVFSVKLQVSEKERIHATLLESILASEAEPQPVKGERLISPQGILRAAIAVLLLAVVIYTTIAGSQFFPMPTLYPGDTVAVRDLIESLPPDAPVLLAVDFSPSLAGEMDAAASGVVEHLMLRGARLVLISTVPTGPVLGQDLLAKVSASPDAALAAYQSSDKVANLGYLAGGPAALLAFATDPRTAAPYAMDGSNAWDQPALQGVNSLADFKQVIVITENSDTGRAWVEQVGASLGSVPLLLVTSAQSAPLMQPYVTSGQIKGMVAGLQGGAAYEQIIQRPGLARTDWDAFQGGLMVAIALIIIGGIANASLALVSRQKVRSEAKR